jgi:hypothetical protein
MVDTNARNVTGGARQLQERFGSQIETVRDSLSGFNDEAVRVIKERPAACLLGALALGFVVGRIISRI